MCRLTSRKYWDQLKHDVRPIYTAVNATAARAAFDDLSEKWGQRYPAMIKLWDNAWAEFIPFLDYDVEIRRVICSTNAIESLNARYRRAIKARGHFPNEQSALNCLYLVTRSLDPTGVGRARWTMRWMSRPEARYRHYCQPVSSGRSPNPACVSPRTGLSTVGSVRHGSCAGRGSGSCFPGIGIA
jgi:transposase-like protein